MEENVDQHESQRWPEWMDIRTFAAYTGISHRTLESWKRLGHLPKHRAVTKRQHRWKRTEIDAWMNTFGSETEVVQ